MSTPDSDDWRIAGQQKYLSGAIFIRRAYSPPSPEWDHDHCDFCWTKFCEGNDPDCLHEGFVTVDGKHWICSNCFNDFRDAFRFSLQES